MDGGSSAESEEAATPGDDSGAFSPDPDTFRAAAAAATESSSFVIVVIIIRSPTSQCSGGRPCISGPIRCIGSLTFPESSITSQPSSSQSPETFSVLLCFFSFFVHCPEFAFPVRNGSQQHRRRRFWWTIIIITITIGSSVVPIPIHPSSCGSVVIVVIRKNIPGNGIHSDDLLSAGIPCSPVRSDGG